LQVRQHRRHDVRRTLQVQLQHRCELRLCAAGAEEYGVDPAERVDRAAHEFLEIVGAADVRRREQRLCPTAPQCLRDGGAAFRVDV